jgi:hypothetical protein
VHRALGAARASLGVGRRPSPFAGRLPNRRLPMPRGAAPLPVCDIGCR